MNASVSGAAAKPVARTSSNSTTSAPSCAASAFSAGIRPGPPAAGAGSA